MISPVAQMAKKSACNAGDMGSIPGLGISPGGGHGRRATQSSIPAWRISMDRGARWATARALAESDTTGRLSTAHFKMKR